MKYYLDGYNLLFKLNNLSNELKVDRNALIEKLDSLLNNLNLKLFLVFDAHKSDNLHFSKYYFKNLEVIYTSKNQSADDFILEMIFISKNPHEIIVVTTDKKLKSKARELKAEVEDFDQFFNFIFSKTSKNSSFEDDFEETPSNIERLIKIFEKRLKDNEDYD